MPRHKAQQRSTRPSAMGDTESVQRERQRTLMTEHGDNCGSPRGEHRGGETTGERGPGHSAGGGASLWGRGGTVTAQGVPERSTRSSALGLGHGAADFALTALRNEISLCDSRCCVRYVGGSVWGRPQGATTASLHALSSLSPTALVRVPVRVAASGPLLGRRGLAPAALAPWAEPRGRGQARRTCTHTALVPGHRPHGRRSP